jgi:uridine kinase
MTRIDEIHACPPRADVQIRLPDGRTFAGPVGTTLDTFLHAINGYATSAVAALVDGRLTELSEPVNHDVDVQPLTLKDEVGRRVYQTSLILLLIAAVEDCFPGTRVAVDHSLTFGGFFCRTLNRPAFADEELAQIEQRMRQMVTEDAPIGREDLPVSRAIEVFRAAGDEAEIRLLEGQPREKVTLRTLGRVKECFYSPLVPSARYLSSFAVRLYPPGFVLQFPPAGETTALGRVQYYPKLTAVFQEYGQWLELLGVPDVGALNQALAGGRAKEIVLVSEALHAQSIAEIARDIARERGRIRLVLMAGPSSSGKTTFSRRLTVQLLANGLRPFPVALDDYFLSREATPKDAEGNYDFESLGALDLDLLNEQLVALMAGQEVTLPRYRFDKGDREVGPTVRLTKDHILLIEGIHGLNPALVPQVPAERVFRIYISALTQLKLDRLNRIPTTDTRLIRRLVRDARDRGYTAQQTIARWESVRRGEAKHIFPYQEHANADFNSFLAYELAVLKPLAEPLLRQVEPWTPEYVEARRLLAFLNWFRPCDGALVPEVSLLREFVGGSSVSEFLPAL